MSLNSFLPQLDVDEGKAVYKGQNIPRALESKKTIVSNSVIRSSAFSLD